MEIKINNESVSIEPGTVIADILGPETQGVAVAVNGKIVRKDERSATTLNPGDDVVIIKAAYGG